MSKKILKVSILLAVITLLASCVTQMPYAASVSFPGEGKYEILGRVEYSGAAGKATYHNLLKNAKKEFPGTDDVVNIIVDAKSVQFLIFVSNSFNMSGTAIKYVE